MTARGVGQSVARGVASGVAAVGASGGSAVADIKAAVGTSTSPTSAGTASVTGVGFTPKVVMPFHANATADGTATMAFLGFGAADGTNQAEIDVASKDSVATSDTQRTHSNASVLRLLNNSFGLAGEATFDSFSSDGFSLNYSSAPAVAKVLNHICLGGDDLEASLTLHQMNGTNADESFAHGLTGGAPDALLFFNAAESSSVPATATQARLGIGAWANANEFYATVDSRDNVSTTQCRRSLGITASLAVHQLASIRRAATVSAVNDSSVEMSYNVTTDATRFYFHMLALRGCTAQVGTFDCNGSTDPLTISTPGITPKLFMPVIVVDGVDNINTVQSDGAITIGASDGTNTLSCGITDQNGVATTNARRFQDSTQITEYNTLGSVRSAAGVSFDSNAVIYDPTIMNSSNWGQGAYLVIGN